MIKPLARLRIWLLLSCNLLLSLNGYRTEASAVPENQLKAAYLIHLSEFTTWPAEKMQDTSFFICLVSGSSLSQPLELIRGHLVKDRQLDILYDVPADKLNICHVFYVEESNEKVFLQSSLKNEPILTVSSKQDFLKEGGLIEYYRDRDKIKMRVNLKMLSQVKLTISSKLLRLMNSDF